MKTKIAAGWMKTAMALAAVFLIAAVPACRKNTVEMADNTASVPASGGMQETKPVLDPALFDPAVGEVYSYAKEIPQIIDTQYCWCKCKENPRFQHKSLLSCFTDEHAANCKICLDEAVITYNMTKEGKTPAEIKEYIDQRFAH